MEKIMAFDFDLAVVGGGASGMAAAIAAGQDKRGGGQQNKIVILESNSRVGKKLLATGNGRCNLTNMGADASRYHGDADFLPSVFKQYSPGKIIEFFNSIGLVCREQEEGRVYPYNLQASAVLDILRLQLEQLGVETICEFKVTGLKKIKDGFLIFSSDRRLSARKVVLASGGMAYPQLGADAGGYDILKSLGHHCTVLYPALVQVTSDPKRSKPLKGVRSFANAVLLAGGQAIRTVSGEVQFTEHGLSGICIFELSRFIGELLGKKELVISLDLMPEYSLKQILEILRRHSKLKSLPSADLLNGCLNKQLGSEVIRQALPNRPRLARELNERDLTAVAGMIKNFWFRVTGTLSWRDAQVTAGGIPLREVDQSLESKCCPGLYLAGEILNIDGDCGGFNLHWAWCSGLLAGHSAASSLLQSNMRGME